MTDTPGAQRVTTGNINTNNKITLKITTPAGVYEGSFVLTDTVDETISIVVREKRLADGDAFTLSLNGTAMSGGRRLWEFGLEDGAVLDLMASGSAV